MALAENRGGGNVRGLGFLDREPHRPLVDHEAKSPVAVDHGRGRGFLHDLEWSAWHDMADLDALDVARDEDDAVGIVAGEVRVHAAARNGVRLFARRTSPDQQRRSDLLQAFGGDPGHGVSCARI